MSSRRDFIRKTAIIGAGVSLYDLKAVKVLATHNINANKILFFEIFIVLYF